MFSKFSTKLTSCNAPTPRDDLAVRFKQDSGFRNGRIWLGTARALHRGDGSWHRKPRHNYHFHHAGHAFLGAEIQACALALSTLRY